MIESANENPQAPPKNAAPSSVWEQSPVGDLSPDLPPVMLICDGLLGMTFTPQQTCDIGFLAVPTCGDSLLAKHIPEITIVRITSDGREYIEDIITWRRESPKYHQITLWVDHPNHGFEIPRFFMTETKDDRDFRRGIDLEIDINERTPYTILDNSFLPKVKVKNGDFYSLLLTPEEYQAHLQGIPPNRINLGKIAYLTAANIDCDPHKSSLFLNFDGRKEYRYPVNGDRLFVLIHNNCRDQDGRKCLEDDHSNGETDFHLYFKAIANPPAIFKIHCVDSLGTIIKPHPPVFDGLHKNIKSALRVAKIVPFGLQLKASTHPTPCGRSGFGVGGSLGGP